MNGNRMDRGGDKVSEVKVRFVQLLAEKQARDGKLYSIADVSNATGIERRRLYQWRDGDVKNIKEEELRILCDFFPCTAGELVCYIPPLANGQKLLTVPAGV
jgi:DNA-binding Xre family transcriptional regulator